MPSRGNSWMSCCSNFFDNWHGDACICLWQMTGDLLFMVPSIRAACLLAYCVLITLAELYLGFCMRNVLACCRWLKLSLAGWYHQWLSSWLYTSIAIPNSFHGVVPRTRSCSGLISLCTRPHQVLTRTLSYQRHCWTQPHQALKRTFCHQHILEVQLSLGCYHKAKYGGF